MPAEMSMRELVEVLTETKIENLATKADLKMYAEDVQSLKEFNETIKVTLEDLKSI